MKSKIATLLLVALTTACGAETDQPGPTGGKTNWLSACERDVDCERLPGAVCEDQTCTKVCSEVADCEDLGRDVTCDAAESVCRELPVAAEPAESESTTDAGDAGPSQSGPEPDTTTTLGEGTSNSGPSATAGGGSPDTAEAPQGEGQGGTTGMESLPMTGGAEGVTPIDVPNMEDEQEPSCGSNTLDPNQGNPPPDPEDCDAIGQALAAGHDAALAGEVLEIEPLVGTWVDDSGEPSVELVLDVTGKGTLRFGQASEFPEATESDETLLTGTENADASDPFAFSHFRPHPGFGYTVIAESGRGSEMSFHILTVEAFEPWCALQAPVASPYAPSCYACEEVAELYSFFSGCGAQDGCYASDRDPDEALRVHCGRVELCAMPYDSVCACTADECFANVEIQGQLNFYPYQVELDPVDTTVLRLRSLSELAEQVTYYLERLPDP